MCFEYKLYPTILCFLRISPSLDLCRQSKWYKNPTSG